MPGFGIDENGQDPGIAIATCYWPQCKISRRSADEARRSRVGIKK